MLARKSLSFISIIAFLGFKANADDFSYKEQSLWYDNYEECILERQSPIELNSNDAVIVSDMPEISFKFYDIPFVLPTKGENNGHTINIELPKPIGYGAAGGSLWQIYDKLLPHFTGGPLLPTQTFIAESVHFHWGSRDAHSLEHVIDSKRHAMEMHIVHRNGKYKTVEEARIHEDGLAVLAVLFKIQPNLSTDFRGLKPIIKALKHVKRFGQQTNIQNLILSRLFENLNTAEFFTYAGSLTTPPCSQSVTWFVFSEIIEITSNQMASFRLLTDDQNESMVNNDRALQAKGDRIVYKRQTCSNEIEPNEEVESKVGVDAGVEVLPENENLV